MMETTAKPKKMIASAPVKELMKEACEEIKRLTEQRNLFYLISKQFVKYIEDTASYKAEPLLNNEYVRAKEIIEEYENRKQRASACKKFERTQKRIHNSKKRAK